MGGGLNPITMNNVGNCSTSSKAWRMEKLLKNMEKLIKSMVNLIKGMAKFIISMVK